MGLELKPIWAQINHVTSCIECVPCGFLFRTGTGTGVMYHLSSGRICHAPGQDPLHLDDDITHYMWQGLQPMVSSSSSNAVYPSSANLLPYGLLPSELTTHRQSVPLADPH